MSSQDVDIDVSVVSSPEGSPRGHSSSNNLNSSNTDDEQTRTEFHHHITAHHTNGFNHSVESRLSPPKTPPEQQPGKTNTNSGYTSFSISSILSRNEPKTKGVITPIPSLPHCGTNGLNGPQDAAMLSR